MPASGSFSSFGSLPKYEPFRGLFSDTLCNQSPSVTLCHSALPIFIALFTCDVHTHACILDYHLSSPTRGFPGVSDSKESACNVGDLGSVLGLGRSPGEENGNPFQYSCLENFMDREAWWATVCGVTKSQAQLSD